VLEERAVEEGRRQNRILQVEPAPAKRRELVIARSAPRGFGCSPAMTILRFQMRSSSMSISAFAKNQKMAYWDPF